MGLVAYSDSEGSESEPSSSISESKTVSQHTSASSSGPRRIKVDLPTPIAQVDDVPRPSKIRRLGTGFGSFNDFLPAPKQQPKITGGGALSAANKGLRPGFSLKTSAEAAFSRSPVHVQPTDSGGEANAGPVIEAATNRAPQLSTSTIPDTAPSEAAAPKPNPLRFKPLSVTNKKKKKTFGSSLAPSTTGSGTITDTPGPLQSSQSPATATAPAPSRAKTSLFGLSPAATSEPVARTDGDTDMTDYQPLLTNQQSGPIPENDLYSTPDHTYPLQQEPLRNDPNPLSAIATELDLTPSQRRQLMGRHVNDPHAVSGMKISHFDTGREYVRNQELAQAGELNQHREVRALAGGRHSLQQLVNAASSQKEALEDKWAAGRRKQADGGAAYGFR